VCAARSASLELPERGQDVRHRLAPQVSFA